VQCHILRTFEEKINFPTFGGGETVLFHSLKWCFVFDVQQKIQLLSNLRKKSATLFLKGSDQ
jgi:hypothetical protein